MVALCKKDPKKFNYVKLPPQYIQSYYENNETIYLPRGSIKLLRLLATKYDQTLKIYNERVDRHIINSLNLRNEITLLPYQSDVINSCLLKQQGIIVAPCGSGKTVIGIGLICRIKRPTLIIVHTLELLNQWIDQLNNKAETPEIGQFGGGVKKITDLTVATIQTLYRLDKDNQNRSILRKFLSQFGCIILDECHHVPAETFLEIINLSPSLYRYGLTATPQRKDGKHFLMYDTFGEIIYNVTDDELECANRIQSCDVYLIETNFYSQYTANEWIQLMEELTTDGDRNNLIVSCVLNSFNNFHSFPLVLSDRVGHCKYLCDRLKREGLDAKLLIGEMDQHLRQSVIASANKQKVDVIVGTTVADEGLDIPTLSDCHLATPTNNKSRIQQRTGRVRRPKDRNSIVHDYCDYKVTSLARNVRSRIGYYKQWGFNISRYH